MVVYNDTLDSIPDHCKKDAFISIIGPTAGNFPDPLFEIGVDMVGGTYIEDDDMRKRSRWRNVAVKFSFDKSNYRGIPV